MRSSPLLTFALLASCATPDGTSPDNGEDPQDGIVVLEPRDRLKRVSVDLRGVHPSEAEYQAIESNPELYEAFVDRYLDDPRFLDRIEEIYNLTYWTRTGDVYFDLRGNDEILRGLSEEEISDSVADEPLRLVRHIVENDLPYTDLVLADYTMADPITAWMWDIEIPEGTEGWAQGHYKDGRTERGVLSMTTMWARYPSAGANANRHRANMISRLLLCDDYLARPVSFSRTQIDALTSGDPEDVIRDNAVCQSCHSSLDPLSAHFFGYWWEVEGDFREQSTYRPEDEAFWRDYSAKPPAYFGRPTTGMEELATEIAKDDRFVQCAVNRVFSGITQRDAGPQDWNELDAHERAFREDGLVVRSLVKSIVMSREYQAEGTKTIEDVELDQQHLDELVTLKQVSPAQLASIVEAKTGYRWTFDGRDGLTDPTGGLVVLGGGIDSRFVTTPSYDPSVGIVFIQERLAQAAAYDVAEHDLAEDRTEDAILLKYVTVEDTPESNPEAFDGQIRQLYIEITGHALPENADEPERLVALWKQLYSVDADPTQAWAGVVSVVLRDPAILFY